jgi:3-hydroxyisobutyrate dehydrogenase-like beta-hydroxyacid dehydrogenase
VVSAGGANSGIFRMIAGAARHGDLDGMRFGIANAAKDLDYYTRMTAEVPLTGNLGNAVRLALAEARGLGFGNALVGHLIAAQARLNGRDLPAPSPA